MKRRIEKRRRSADLRRIKRENERLNLRLSEDSLRWLEGGRWIRVWGHGRMWSRAVTVTRGLVTSTFRPCSTGGAKP